jgi:hypothetical protein
MPGCIINLPWGLLNIHYPESIPKLFWSGLGLRTILWRELEIRGSYKKKKTEGRWPQTCGTVRKAPVWSEQCVGILGIKIEEY